MRKARRYLTYPHVVSTLALFVALGGSAWALSKNSVGSKQIKSNAVKVAELADNSVTSAEVANGSLLGADFASGQLPAGAQGPQGEPGPPGPSTGPAGGDLAGDFPNPSIAAGAVTPPKFGVLPAARVRRTTPQAITTATIPKIEFDAERFDPANMHDNSTDNTRVTAPIGGIYLITAGVRWEGNVNGGRFISIRVNGERVQSQWGRANGGSNTDQSVSTVFKLAPGDFVELEVSQDTGGNLNVIPNDPHSLEMSVAWIGPG